MQRCHMQDALKTLYWSLLAYDHKQVSTGLPFCTEVSAQAKHCRTEHPTQRHVKMLNVWCMTNPDWTLHDKMLN